MYIILNAITSHVILTKLFGLVTLIWFARTIIIYVAEITILFVKINCFNWIWNNIFHFFISFLPFRLSNFPSNEALFDINS